MYVFTQPSKVQQLFVQQTRAGGVCINDTIMHFAGKYTEETIKVVDWTLLTFHFHFTNFY